MPGMKKNSIGRVKKHLQDVTVGSRTRDIFIFLFFVLICTIFWFVRELEDSFSTEIVMPVQLTDVPDGIIITTDVPHEIRLNIHDKGIELVPLLLRGATDTLRLSFSDYDNHELTGHAQLLLPHLQNSLRRLLPVGATVTSMSPDTLSFYYNRGIHRRLPVRLRGSVEAAQQYCVTHTRLIPDSVDVYAPHALLDTMQAAYTERVHLGGLIKSGTQPVRMSRTRGMRIFPDSVKLFTEVDLLTRQSCEVPVQGINFPANKTLRTFPSSVKVSYLVPQGRARQIDLQEFTVVISYTELMENHTSRCHPHLSNTPKGVTGALMDPLEVDYLLESLVNEEEQNEAQQKKGRK